MSMHSHGMPFDFILKRRQDGDFHIWTDASTSFGVGAVSDSGSWLSSSWQSIVQSNTMLAGIDKDIFACEVFSVLVAVKLLHSHTWTSKAITIHCDNSAAVHCINRLCVKKNKVFVMDCLRDLALFAHRNKFFFNAVHIEGVLNTTVDALSRGVVVTSLCENMSQSQRLANVCAALTFKFL